MTYSKNCPNCVRVAYGPRMYKKPQKNVDLSRSLAAVNTTRRCAGMIRKAMNFMSGAMESIEFDAHKYIS